MPARTSAARIIALVLLLLSLLLGSLAPWDSGGVESAPATPTPTVTAVTEAP